MARNLDPDQCYHICPIVEMDSENSHYKHGDTFTTPHLNTHGLEIRATPDRGRGIYGEPVISKSDAYLGVSGI